MKQNKNASLEVVLNDEDFEVDTNGLELTDDRELAVLHGYAANSCPKDKETDSS